ncbi:MAG: CopD family protein [Polyangiales bacterium]
MNHVYTVLALHLLAVILWVGSLVSITRLLGVALASTGEARARLADAARTLYKTVSSVWMGVALLAGLGLIALTPGIFRLSYFHPKLTAAIVMLALHFVLGAKVRKAQATAGDDAAFRAALASVRGLQIAVLAVAALAVASVTILKYRGH